MRLSTRLLLAIWLPLLALGVSAAFAVRIAAAQLANLRADQAADLSLSMEQQRFRGFFAGRKALLLSWVHTSEVQSGDPERATTFLAGEEAAFSRLFEHLYFNSLDGTVWPARGAAPFNVKDRPYWPRVLAGEPFVTDVILSRDTGAGIVLVGEPVRGPDGAVVGALTGSVPLEALFGHLGTQTERPTPGLEVVVRGHDGMLYGKTRWKDRLGAGPVGETFTLPGDGPVVRGWARPLDVNGWELIALRPEADVFVNAQRLQALVFLLLAVALIISFFVSRWLSRRLTRPMLELRDAQRRFGQGDLTARVTPRTDDEVGELGLAFNDMATRLSEAEGQRRALESSLAQSQRLESLGRLAGGIAHDFNNLLTIIINLSEVVGLELGPEHPAAADLRAITEAGQQSAMLTRQLLAFARKQASEPKVFELDAQLAGWQTMLKRLIPENITLRLEPNAGGASVRIDPTQLMQVVVNLAVNARDAMPQGGALTLSTDADGERVRVRVADTGTGLSDEARAHLFEPFFTTKGHGRGTGLGLATCHGIVHQSGGDITAESGQGNPQPGTVFTVTLPRVAPKDAPSPVPTALPKSVPRRLVLVEDDAGVRATLTSLLQRAGHTVTALSPAEARVHRDFDVLITDVVMPTEDGAALAEAVLETHPTVGIVLLSGYAPALSPALLKSPRVVFLQKPPSQAALEEALVRVSTSATGA